MTIEELTQKMTGATETYHMIDMHKDKEFFYAISDEVLFKPENYLLLIGKVINLMMDGELTKATQIIDRYPPESLVTLSLKLINPLIKRQEFIDILKYLKKINRRLHTVILTAGRPYILNGFNDFTRLGPFLKKKKTEIIDLISYIYGSESSMYIYYLCLAEWYYQTDRLFDAAELIGSCIHDFYKKNENRMLFSALFLQSKTLLANGTTVKISSFIEDMKKRIKEEGKAEFDFNITAVEVYFALYEGNYGLVNEWLLNDAPDEYADFNMLDLYRYMIKLRCYLIFGKHTSLIALIEKLRPLLTVARRFLDLCECDLLLCMSLYDNGRKQEAFDVLEKVLKIAKKRKYIRLICDEGQRMLTILIDYINSRGESEFLLYLVERTRNMAIHYPFYLILKYSNNEQFTKMEIDILTLLQQGKNKEEIAELFFVGVDDIKYHIKKIYLKLDANSATKAIWNAKQLGIIK